jgi:hypothetical protein
MGEVYPVFKTSNSPSMLTLPICNRITMSKKKKTTRLGKSYIDVFASSMKDKIPSRIAPEAKTKVFQKFL